MNIKEEILLAVSAEQTKVADGMMNALAALGLMIYASGNITRDEFLNISEKNAVALRATGDRIGAALLEGMCARIRHAAKVDPPAAAGREKH